MEDFKTVIKAIRSSYGLTQAELANILGLGSYTRVAEYEAGRRTPSKSVLIILALLDAGKMKPADLGYYANIADRWATNYNLK